MSLVHVKMKLPSAADLPHRRHHRFHDSHRNIPFALRNYTFFEEIWQRDPSYLTRILRGSLPLFLSAAWEIGLEFEYAYIRRCPASGTLPLRSSFGVNQFFVVIGIFTLFLHSLDDLCIRSVFHPYPVVFFHSIVLKINWLLNHFHLRFTLDYICAWWPVKQACHPRAKV